MRRARRQERGVVLLLVLWVFMVLGVFALDFAQYMRGDASASMNFAVETQGYYLAVAGMNRALFLCAKKSENQNQPVDPDEVVEEDPCPRDGTFHEFTLDGAAFRYRLQGEDGRIPLNASIDDPDKKGLYQTVIHEVVQHIVAQYGKEGSIGREDQEAIDTITDSIVDWRDCDSMVTPTMGAEDKYYQNLPHPYVAKNGYFDSVEELLRVRGVTPELFYGSEDRAGFADVFSVYPRGENEGREGFALNADQVSAAVITALTGLPLADARDLLGARGSDQSGDITQWLRQQLQAIPGIEVTGGKPKVVRVEACGGDFQSGRNIGAVAAIVQFDDAAVDEGPRILSWVDRPPIHCNESAAPSVSPASAEQHA